MCHLVTYIFDFTLYGEKTEEDLILFLNKVLLFSDEGMSFNYTAFRPQQYCQVIMQDVQWMDF